MLKIDIKYWGALAVSGVTFMLAGYELFDHQYLHSYILFFLGVQIGYKSFVSPIKPITYE
jgi:hypothetical protein